MAVSNELAGEIRDALEDLVDAIRGPGIIEVPLTSCTLASTGALLAVFADGASVTPGFQVTDSEAQTIRWNNHATPAAIMFKVPWNEDVDTTANVTLKFQVSKTGATLADATTITVAAYNQVTAALHDADSNYGGATGAVTGDATAKTIAVLSRTIAVSAT